VNSDELVRMVVATAGTSVPVKIARKQQRRR
jgi:hypothetical protein